MCIFVSSSYSSVTHEVCKSNVFKPLCICVIRHPYPHPSYSCMVVLLIVWPDCTDQVITNPPTPSTCHGFAINTHCHMVIHTHGRWLAITMMIILKKDCLFPQWFHFFLILRKLAQFQLRNLQKSDFWCALLVPPLPPPPPLKSNIGQVSSLKQPFVSRVGKYCKSAKLPNLPSWWNALFTNKVGKYLKPIILNFF